MFAAQRAEERKIATDYWYKVGGEYFLEWTTINYRTHTGEPLDLSEKYYRDLAVITGNPWIEKIDLGKAAQRGWSELLFALAAFALSELKIPTALGMESSLKKRELVSQRVQPAFGFCPPLIEAAAELKSKTKRDDLNSQSSMSVGGVSFTIYHVNSGSPSEVSGRQAASGISSFTAFLNLKDETELWPPHILDIVENRMSASELRTKPQRAGSTPGADGGIVDTRVKSGDHIFQWRVVCPHCYHEQFIDPFGNLLRPVEVELENGVREMAYLDAMVKPIHWFYHDENNKIETAYIGCTQCDGELDKETLGNGEFACTITNESALEISDRAIREEKIIRNVGIWMPALASRKFNPSNTIRKFFATNIIASLVGLVQEDLGKPFSPIGGKINEGKLMNCVGLPLPVKREPDLITMGVDQGRPNWGIICEVFFPENTPDKKLLWQDAHLNCIWHGEIAQADIIDKAIAYGVDIIGIDNEPEFNAMADIAEKNLPDGPSINTFTKKRNGKKAQVYLMDQMDLKGLEFKRVVRSRQNSTKQQSRSTTIVIHNIDRTTFLDFVKQRIYRELFHLPPGLVLDPKDDKNFLRHYLTSDRLDGKWLKASPDHYFHAHSFLEAAILVSLYEPGSKGNTVAVISGKI